MKKRQKSQAESNPSGQSFIIFQSTPSRPQERWKVCCATFRLVCLVFFGWIMSLFLVIRILINPVNAVVLHRQFKNESLKLENLPWIGHITGLLTYILMPMTCGLIDIGGVSYRCALTVATVLLTVGNLSNAGCGHPYFLLFTDCFLCGVGAALALSVIMLTLDTTFPEPSRFRIVATTFCQGSIIGSFLFTQLFSTLILNIGWSNMQVINAAILLFLGTLLVFLIPEDGLHPTSQRPLYDEAHEVGIPWTKRLLGMSSKDMDDSPTVVPWYIARLFICIIHIGIFTWFTRTTDVERIPELALIFGWRSIEMLVGYSFSAGQTISYILGGILGSVAGRGHLIKVYTFSALILFFGLIIWQLLLGITIKSTATNIALAIVAFLCGALMGLQETFLFAASQEATTIHSRRSFPFSQMMNGIAFVVTPVLDDMLRQFAVKVNFIIYAVLTLINFIIFMFTLHRLYTRKLAMDPFVDDTELTETSIDYNSLFRNQQPRLRSGFLATKTD